MHLIQILLPLYDNAGNTFGEECYSKVRRELTERFGGLTAFTRAPAQGLWKDAGQTKRDDIVVFEVMVEEADADRSAIRRSGNRFAARLRDKPRNRESDPIQPNRIRLSGRAYRRALESTFKQDEIVIRAQPVTVL